MSPQPISEARLAANRANAQKSTGPRTPEGKATVANNALKHGLRSERNPLDLANDTCLPSEREEFLATLEGFLHSLQPATPLETQLVERLAQLNLRLHRALRMETTHLSVHAAFEETAMTAAGINRDASNARQNNSLAMLAFLRDPNALTLIGRYESRLSRDFARTLAQLHHLQKLRKQTQQDIQRPQHSGTGSSVPSETETPSSEKNLRSRVDIGACPPAAAQAPNESLSENVAEQTQPLTQPGNSSSQQAQILANQTQPKTHVEPQLR